MLLKTLYSIAYSDQFESKISFEAQSILLIFLKFDTILIAFDFKTKEFRKIIISYGKKININI